MQQRDALRVYFDLMLSNGVVSLYKVVCELRIFDKYLPEDRFTEEEVIRDHSFHETSLKMFFNSLVTVGLLSRDGEEYMISPVLSLLKGNYQNLSTEYWEHLPKLLKTGEPFKRMDQVSDSEKEYQSQVKSLEWMMTPSALSAFLALNEKRDGLKVLDVGAGSGVWSFNFLYKNPTTTATLCDWPLVLKVAKDTASRKNISERVSYIEGNYHQSELPQNHFDYAILGNVTHIESVEGNKSIFKKISQSLKEGGKLLILDAYGTSPEGELARSLYQMGLTIRTVQGRVYYPEEMKPWLIEAGFKTFEFHSLEATPHSMGMLVCLK